MAVFPVVIDACVLFNAPVRDTLLRAAEYGLYRLHWSQIILDETTKNLMTRVGEKPARMTEAQANYFVEQLTNAFPEAMVQVPPSLILSMKNDLKDRHVAAAACAAHAQVIVTFNLDDFAPSYLEEFNIEAQHPDVFLLHLFTLRPTAILQILLEQAADLRGFTFDSLLEKLQLHVPNFVAAVKSRVGER